jgi:tyrosinase
MNQIDGTVVNLQDVPSLEVTVSATPLHHPVTGAPLPSPGRGPEDALPVPGEVSWHHHITRGRQGGAQDA